MAVDVFDDAGRPVRGQVGELVCTQPWPGMTRGLWHDRERYLETYWSRWPDVWWHGDFASVSEDGQWFLHGRSDDTIKIAGKRLGPAEVETVLVGHPAVLEAAAVGVPDELKGESLVVFVVPRPGVTADEQLREELRARVTDQLGAAFRPAAVRFTDALPKTRSAKVLRRAIRAVATGAEPGDLSGLEDPSALSAIAAARSKCTISLAPGYVCVRCAPTTGMRGARFEPGVGNGSNGGSRHQSREVQIRRWIAKPSGRAAVHGSGNGTSIRPTASACSFAKEASPVK